MNPLAAITWHLARAGGLVAWALLVVATAWGLLLTTRVLGRRPGPSWLLDVHRHLGNLALGLTGLHVAAIWLDDHVDYSIGEVVIPFTDDRDRLAVAAGVAAMWLLLAVQVSSWGRGRLGERRWRRLHLGAVPLVVVATVHGILAGTDATHPVVMVLGVVLAAEVLLLAGVRLFRVRPGRGRPPRTPPRRAVSATPAHRGTSTRGARC